MFYRPIYGTVPHAYYETFSVFLLNKPRVVSGVSGSFKEPLNQVDKL